MKVKKYAYSLLMPLMTALLSVAVSSCGDVAEQDRWTDFTPLQDGSDDDDIQWGKKNVLIEDFTGQRCINCPDAAVVIGDLQARLTSEGGASRIVAVAIHGGAMALSEDIGGLANEQGLAYNEYWQVDTWPAGIVDRQGGVVKYTEWSSHAIGRLSDEPLCKLDVKASMVTNEADSTCSDLAISVQGRLKEKAPNNAKLQVWVTESDIVGLQFMPDGSRSPQYVHNHVFRAAVNGAWGEDIGESDSFVKEYAFTTKTNWNAANLAVVAFVYTEADGVLQVVEKHVTE